MGRDEQPGGYRPLVWACGFLLLAGATWAQVSVPADSTAIVRPATDPVPAPGDSTVAYGVARAEEQVNLWDTGISPTGAVLMTPLFPGWGQLYADNSWRAALAYGAQMFFWTNLLSRERQAVRYQEFADRFPVDDPNHTFYGGVAEESWEQMRDFAWWSGGSLLIIALDAYVGAHLFNFDRDPVPVPDRWDDAFGPVSLAPGWRDDGLSVVVFQWRKTF